jgi:hypothetical protein
MAITAVVLAAAPNAAPSGLSLPRFTMDAGGDVFTTGGAFELSGTVGQPDASRTMNGGAFELTGGFWFRLGLGDCNEDGLADLFDYDDFEVCMGGPSVWPGEAPCPCLDLDADNDVDLADFAEFQRGFGE